MARFKNTLTNVVVSVDDSKADRFGDGWEPADEAPEPQGYSGQKVAELRAEIDQRNEGRDEDDMLSVEGNKADLIATLVADDETE